MNLLATACGDTDDGGSPSATEPSPVSISVGGEPVSVPLLVAAVGGLCDARVQALGSDKAGAGATFFDLSHDPMHTLARALDDVDRANAARLLEAKERVEADLDDPEVAASDLADHLSELHATSAAGLGRLQVEVQPCAT